MAKLQENVCDAKLMGARFMASGATFGHWPRGLQPRSLRPLPPTLGPKVATANHGTRPATAGLPSSAIITIPANTTHISKQTTAWRLVSNRTSPCGQPETNRTGKGHRMSTTKRSPGEASPHDKQVLASLRQLIRDRRGQLS